MGTQEGHIVCSVFKYKVMSLSKTYRKKSLKFLHFNFMICKIIILRQVDSSIYFNSKRPIISEVFNYIKNLKITLLIHYLGQDQSTVFFKIWSICPFL